MQKSIRKKKKDYITSKALEELESIIEICGGYQKLGLTPITEQSFKSAVPQQQHFKSEKEDKKEALQSSGKTITEHMITNFICKDYKMPSKKSEEQTGTTNYSSTNQNIIPPQTTPIGCTVAKGNLFIFKNSLKLCSYPPVGSKTTFYSDKAV